MEIIIIKTLQLFASLSILVLVHEFGHFLFSRIFGVRVEKFYLFFNPWFTLFKFKPKGSDTEYGLGWLPLGGYCKIAGMIDESMDKEAMAQPPKPDEFRSKKAFPRFMIMVGGVLFNFILALIIYSGILFVWGDSYLPTRNASLGMEYSEVAKSMGFRDGDVLWACDGTPVDRYNERTIRRMAKAHSVTVLRDGKEIAIAIPDTFMTAIIKAKQGFAQFRIPMVIKEPIAGSVAAQAGLLPGDSVVGIDNVPTASFDDVAFALREHAGTPISVQFYRNNTSQSITLTPDSAGKIGVACKSMAEVYPIVTVHYSLFKAIPAGIQKGVATLHGYVSDFEYVFTKEGASSIGGFGAIGNLFPAQFSWLLFWELTAFLSIILAFMNILPIPALDGGHILFLLWEMITGRKPSDKFLEYAQMVGMVILFSLLIYANGNDLFRFIFK